MYSYQNMRKKQLIAVLETPFTFIIKNSQNCDGKKQEKQKQDRHKDTSVRTHVLQISFPTSTVHLQHQTFKMQSNSCATNRNTVQVGLKASERFACSERFQGQECPSCVGPQTDCHTLWSRGKHTSKPCKTGIHSLTYCTHLLLSLSDTWQDADTEGRASGTHH